MRCGSVQCQGCADTNADNHEAQLVVQAVCQNFSQVVFNNSKENRKGSHYGADID